MLLDFVSTQAIVLCFRLHFTKDNITNNTAAATVRQVVTVVFERMVAEDERFKGDKAGTWCMEDLKLDVCFVSLAQVSAPFTSFIKLFVKCFFLTTNF